MIQRSLDERRVREALAESPVVVLTGPRQAGKSTLARSLVSDRTAVFDLEDPRDQERLADPTLELSGRPELVVIDEAQLQPGLFQVLRVLVDEDRRPGRFLVLGSASPDLIGLASESLAGRVRLLELPGLRLSDVGAESLDDLWIKGALPLAYLDPTDRSNRWRDDYIATFLERDLANLGIRVPAALMRRFWTMVAHYHAQTWNGSELARSLALSQPTVRSYLDALTDALVIRQLQPWHANISKRQVRAPKIYVRDSGLLHRLLGIDDRHALLGHPKLGASWEGFVVEQLLTMLGARDASFWSTHAGAEIDLRIEVGGRLLGVEIKRTDRPKMTPSIRSALEDLALDGVVVLHAGRDRFRLADRVRAIPASVALLDPAALTEA